MRTVTLGMILAYVAIAAAFALPKYDTSLWDHRDAIALTGLAVLLVWLLAPSRSDGLLHPDAHKSASDSIAFRLGKRLNRVWRRLRGRA